MLKNMVSAQPQSFLAMISYFSPVMSDPQRLSQVFFCGTIGAIDLDLLRKDAVKLDCSEVFIASRLDDKLLIFNSHLIQLFGKHAQIQPVYVDYMNQ